MTILSREWSRVETLRRLEDIWQVNPHFYDMRFGQFIVNLLSFVGRDPWHLPDEEWPEILRQFEERAAKPGQFRGEATYERP